MRKRENGKPLIAELKKCPFCQSQPIAVKEVDKSKSFPKYDGDYTVRCTNLMCIAYRNVADFTLLSDAVEAWNRRAEPEETA